MKPTLEMTPELLDDSRKLRVPPRVSVIIASYNYGRYIGQALQSVLDQTFADWELIIVDDGSTDETFQQVQPFMADPRVRYHWQENRGQSAAKNVGIRLTQAPLIAFLDADDAWRPTKLEKQVALFDVDSELGVAYTNGQLMDPHGGIVGEMNRTLVRGDVLAQSIRYTVPPFSSTVVRRSVLDDVGAFDETISLAVDYDLWLRVAFKYRFDYVAESLLLYRMGHNNLSRRGSERRMLVLQQILPRFLAKDGVHNRLGRRLIAEAYADTYINVARDVRPDSVIRALAWHIRAIIVAPWMWDTWRSSVRCVLPDTVVSGVKAIVQSR